MERPCAVGVERVMFDIQIYQIKEEISEIKGENEVVFDKAIFHLGQWYYVRIIRLTRYNTRQ